MSQSEPARKLFHNLKEKTLSQPELARKLCQNLTWLECYVTVLTGSKVISQPEGENVITA